MLAADAAAMLDAMDFAHAVIYAHKTVTYVAQLVAMYVLAEHAVDL